MRPPLTPKFQRSKRAVSGQGFTICSIFFGVWRTVVRGRFFHRRQRVRLVSDVVSERVRPLNGIAASYDTFSVAPDFLFRLRGLAAKLTISIITTRLTGMDDQKDGID